MKVKLFKFDEIKIKKTFTLIHNTVNLDVYLQRNNHLTRGTIELRKRYEYL